MSNWPDLSRPETLKLSKEDYEHYCNDNVCLNNSVARKDPSQSVFDALYENRENYKKIRIGNQSICEIIKEL